MKKGGGYSLISVKDIGSVSSMGGTVGMTEEVETKRHTEIEKGEANIGVCANGS